MKTILCRVVALAFILFLSACTAVAPSPERDYFPGGSPIYSYGVSQSKENFANVERAQSWYGLYTKEKYWSPIRPGIAPASINMLQIYYPLSVRWQLKDGRQFIAENIDIRGIMREYFRNHDIKLPWQRERRPYDQRGDSDPSLVHEIKGDTVIIKWLITTNHTPVNERFTPSGAATWWHRTKEEFVVTTIKGTPASGINFDKWVEVSK